MASNQHPHMTGEAAPSGEGGFNEGEHHGVDDEVVGEEVRNANEDHDIIAGRGRGFYGMPGNLHFHNVVEEYVDDYFSSNLHYLKQQICQTIMDRMHQEGRRFLTQTNDNRYFHMSQKKVASKIQQRLRRQKSLQDSGEHLERSSLSFSSYLGNTSADDDSNTSRQPTGPEKRQS